MNIFTKAQIILHIIRWRRRWYKRDTHYRFTVPGNPKFMGARDAVNLIPDGAVIGTSGLGANQWASVVYQAMREVYQETGHPRDLSIVCIGGQGARGRAPGSLEELGVEGLCTRFFTGHTETFKSILRLADAGKLELQCLPQGVIAYLIDGQERGEESLLTSTGVGSFMDPRIGRGTPVVGDAPQYVEVEGGQLRYRLPKITAAIFNAPSADREGNIYMKNAAMIGESYEITQAAKRNGGLVIANVGQVVDKGHDAVFLPATAIDAIVVHPDTEQAGAFKHIEYSPIFVLNSTMSVEEGIARLKFANDMLRYTPKRTPVDFALARTAAALFAENAHRGSLVNIGVGLPEEVCRLIYLAGLHDAITLFSESGVVGGLPAPGVFFGASVCPKEMVASTSIFRRCDKALDVSILGLLQVDSDGNVNVSKRGEGAINYVGPGGFIDFTAAAQTIVFVGSWMFGGKITLDGGQIKVVKRGKPKFVDKVDEITFSGKQALASGKRVFYVTNVGVFRLTDRGIELIRVAPGVDIQKDIIGFSPMRIALPTTGIVPLVDAAAITGKDFKLTLDAH